MGAVIKVIGVVLGIDPSYKRTGLVAWNGSQVVWSRALPALVPGPSRLLRAARSFGKTLLSLATPVSSIEMAVIEDAAYGSPNRLVVAKLVALSAIYRLVLERFNIDYLEVSPTFIKRYIAGSGKAEKAVVAQELKQIYGISFQGDKGFDLSDAAALAVWGWEKRHGRRT